MKDSHHWRNYAYTGGMNVADYYIKDYQDRQLARYAHPYTRENREIKIFLEMWRWNSKQQVGRAAYYPTIFRGTGLFDKASLLLTACPHPFKEMRKTCAASIRSAQHCILVVNLTLFLHSIRGSLEDALARGVKVEIMNFIQIGHTFHSEAFYLAHKPMMTRN